MTEKKFRFTDFAYWGLVLTVCAPVLILGVFLVLLLTLPGSTLSPGGFSILLITKAVFYGGGIVLILLGSFLRRNYPAVLLSLLAFLAVFFQLLPPQISPSGMDVVLGLPGLTLALIAIVTWLPDFQRKNCYLCLAFGILCGLVIAYQLFEVLALSFLPYALPSFLQSQSWLGWFETFGKWIIYLSLIFKLFKGVNRESLANQNFGFYFKSLLGITALTIIFSMLLITSLFMQLQKSSATVEYVVEPRGEFTSIELKLPVPQFKNGDDVIAATDFAVFNAQSQEMLESDLKVIQTEYGKALHFVYEGPAREKLLIRGQVKSYDLGWYLGRDEVPVILTPRILDEEWNRATQIPVVPEHNAIYTAVYCGNGVEGVNLSYCLELVVKGIKDSAYQQVFTAYLPFNYMEGFQLKEGWQLVPMIEEIVVRELN